MTQYNVGVSRFKVRNLEKSDIESSKQEEKEPYLAFSEGDGCSKGIHVELNTCHDGA